MQALIDSGAQLVVKNFKPLIIEPQPGLIGELLFIDTLSNG